MSCPDIETLISYATSPDGCDDIASHVLECPECRKNLEIIHETMLAEKWTAPEMPPEPNEQSGMVDASKTISGSSTIGAKLDNYLHAKIYQKF